MCLRGYMRVGQLRRADRPQASFPRFARRPLARNVRWRRHSAQKGKQYEFRRFSSVRFLGPDVALMHAVGGTVMRGKSVPSPERDSIQTLVATKRAGEWRLAAFQNTRVRPIGRNAAGTFVWILSDWLWKVFHPKK
jgi:hypothetical protein